MRDTGPDRLKMNEYMPSHESCRMFHQLLDSGFGVHWHEFYELCFVISGAGSNIVNGVSHRLAPGSLFLLTPADFHEIHPQPGATVELYNFIFSENMLDEAVRSLLFHRQCDYSVLCKTERYDVFRGEFERMWLETAEPRKGSPVIIRSTLHRILVELARELEEAEENGMTHGKMPERRPEAAPHPAVRRALVFLHHHFRAPVTLEDAARQAGLAPHYFSEKFRLTTGIPFQTYLQELRLELARKLLSATDLPITEICHSSGFNTLTHFERSFKRKYGAPPRAFRTRGTETSETRR